MKPRDARVAAALISGRLVREIALEEKVTERQVFRILARAEVREEIDRQTREVVRAAGLVVRTGARAAATALVAMASGAAPASSARTAACLGVLGTAAKLGELEDVLRRLDAIDDRLARSPVPEPEEEKFQ